MKSKKLFDKTKLGIKKKAHVSIGLAGVLIAAGILFTLMVSSSIAEEQNATSESSVVNVSDIQILSANGASPDTQLHFRSERATPAERRAAGERFKAIYKPAKAQARAAVQGAVAAPSALNPGGVPHYFGPYANWANSPMPMGAVTSITLTNGGSGYSANPTVTITDAYNTGSGATATATVDPTTGVITSITIGNGGIGYTAPDVIVDDPTGTGAAATASIGGPLTGGIKKFVDSMPGLDAAGKNDLGQYISVAVPDKTTYTGSDYYEIAVVQYTEKMHKDLPPTTLRGYVQLETPVNAPTSKHIALLYPNGTAIKNPTTNQPVLAYDNPHYLGPLIVSQKGTPVRVKFHNYLPTGTDGNLFIPVDTTVMGAGMGPAMIMPMMADRVGGTGATVQITTMSPHNFQAGHRIMLHRFTPDAYNGEFIVLNAGLDATHFQVKLNSDPGGPATVLGHIMDMYTENRAAVHLHGGDTVWISDGTPHQWTTPAGEHTYYPEGVSVKNVPDMDNGNEPQGTLTFYYTNNQSARLMFYHDHSYGITRLNVYSGEAAGFLVTDQVEQDLIKATNSSGVNPGLAKVLPDIGIPLIIQDKTFVDNATIADQDPTWNWGTGARDLTTGNILKAITGDLWMPHVYMTNQNPWDITGTNAFGRWMYSPWFWPPAQPTVRGLIPNPYYTGGTGTAAPWEPPMIPGTPNPSMAMEGFMDTPLVNGAVYPNLTLDPKPYRFRILDACNERFLNLQLYQATPIISNITVTNGGSGYSDPIVTITDPTGKGKGATAIATVTDGVVTGITLTTVGSNYTAPVVTITDATIPGIVPGAGATATANVYTHLTEVGMVPAVKTSGYPAGWPTDGRDGGVPDPATMGPSFYQIGTEGGFLPAPAVIENQPVTFIVNPQAFNFGNIDKHTLLLGPAERADVIIDFSKFAGKTLILYNDAPAAFPAADPRVDYYTNDLDQRDTGGAPTTQPGYGPNTRTIMQIRINNTAPSAPYDLATLNAVFAKTAVKKGVFEVSQPSIIVPQTAYNSAYNKAFTTDITKEYVQLFEFNHTFLNISGSTLTIPLEPKAIHDEMNAAYDPEYGRMSGILGLEMPSTSPLTQNFMLYPFASPPVEIINDSMTPMSEPSGVDGTQIWKITHNGVDTHTYHFHLYNVQLINRVAWDGILMPPDANELGWKETVRTNPLEHTIVALRPVAPKVPFKVPNSTRLIDPTMPAGEALMGPPGGFIDPSGNPVTVINHMVNFGWEYMIHCHLLGHEEMDMMHAQAFVVAPEAPSNLVAALGNSVVLTWMDNSAGETGFTVQRAADDVFKTDLISFPVGPNVATYTDTNVAEGKTYFYRVVANNVVGDTTVYAPPSAGFPTKSVDSAFSNTATITIPVVIKPPSQLVVRINTGPLAANAPRAAPQANPTRITLTWIDESNNEEKFEVWRSDNKGQFAQVGSVPRTPDESKAVGGTVTFNDMNLVVGGKYKYYVIASNQAGSSLHSNEAAMDFSKPADPSNLVGNAVKTGIRYTVTLNWNDNSINENNFQIQRSISSRFSGIPTQFTVGAGVTSYVDKNVARYSRGYYYRARATNALGSSGWSNVVHVNTP